MLISLNFIILNVSNVQKERDFYIEKMGLSIEAESPEFVQFKPVGGSTLALQKVEHATPLSGGELWWMVDNADATHDELASRGARVVDELKDMPFGRVFAIEDPVGHKMNFFHLRQQ